MAIHKLHRSSENSNSTGGAGHSVARLDLPSLDARAHLAAIVESSEDPIYSEDLAGVITSWNPAAERLYGYVAAEVLGKPTTVILPPEKQTEEDLVLARIRAGERIEHFETVRLTKGGHRLEVSLTVSPLRDAEGRLIGASKIARDITERKRVEAKLQEQGRILDLAPVLIRDADNRIVLWTTGMASLYGYTAEEALGQVSHDLLQTGLPVSRAAFDAAVLATGEWTGELTHTTRDGRRIVVASHQVLHRDAQGRPQAILEVNSDITALKDAEAALREAHATLEQRVAERTAALQGTVQALTAEVQKRTAAEAQLRKLSAELTVTEQREHQRLAHVLHDGLQQLLVAAQFRTTFLARHTDVAVQEHTAKLRELLQDAVKASRSLTAELNPPALQEAGLGPALEWLGRWMQETHSLTVAVTVQTAREPEAEAVKVLLFQAVRELLFNVVKHAGVRQASVTVSRTDDHIQVVVADEGRGFDPGTVPAATVGGLGLPSIRQRLTFLGGSFEIQSAPGRGSQFTLTVPIHTHVSGRFDSEGGPNGE